MEMEAFLPPEKKIDKKPNPLSTLLRNPKVLVISLLSIVVVGWMTFLTLKVSKESLSETEIDFPGIHKIYFRRIFKRIMSSRCFSLKD